MMRLKSKLLSLNANKSVPTKIYSPANCEEVRIPFRQDKVAKVVGRLANEIQIPTLLPSPPSSPDEDDQPEDKKAKIGAAEGQIVSGVLVQNDFKLSLMAPEDLKEYAGLTTTTILCRQRLTLSAAGVDLIKWALEGTFGTVKVTIPSSTNGSKIQDPGTNGKIEEEADEELKRDQETVLEVMGAVRVRVRERGEIEVEWEGNVANDGIADTVLAVLFTVESSPAAVKRAYPHHSDVPFHIMTLTRYQKTESSRQNPHTHSHDSDVKMPQHRNLHANITSSERLSRLCMFLEAHFGEDAITPLAKPRPNSPSTDPLNPSSTAETTIDDPKAEAAELDRLHDLGIPVPGLEVRVDKYVATVWLETLDVECGTRVFGDRVRAVVERAAEVVAPLWE